METYSHLVHLFLLFASLIMSLTSMKVVSAQTCTSTGFITGRTPPEDYCDNECDYGYCIQGQKYPTYTCSPAVTNSTKAILTIYHFEAEFPSACDHGFHLDDTLIVALSTGWYNNNSRCFKNITINGNGKSVKAMVVDECSSRAGCNDDNDYQPPCRNNVVGGSTAVWTALGVPIHNRGELDVYWSDA